MASRTVYRSVKPPQIPDPTEKTPAAWLFSNVNTLQSHDAIFPPIFADLTSMRDELLGQTAT